MRRPGASRDQALRLRGANAAHSALDTSTEKDIQKALQHLMEGRSSLSIAHRLSVRNAYPSSRRCKRLMNVHSSHRLSDPLTCELLSI